MAIAGANDPHGEERELVSRSAQGDECAFRELVERHEAAVCALARWKLRDAHLAEELAQETFLRLYRSLHTFRFDSSLRTWLSRVTLNLCNDHLRRMQRQARATLPAPVQASEPGPEAAMLSREQNQRVNDALTRLPQELQEVVLLRYASELSYAEIAAALALPLGTVCTRLARAVKLLGEEFRAKEAGHA